MDPDDISDEKYYDKEEKEALAAHLKYFSLCGRVLGKAIMEQQPIAATLSLPLRKQILSLPITFSDLEFVDPQVYRNLKMLETYDDIEALDLDFTVSYAAPARFEGASGSNARQKSRPNHKDIDDSDSDDSADTGSSDADSPSRASNSTDGWKEFVPATSAPHQIFELKPGGKDIAVTNENKNEYLQLLLRNRVLTSVQAQVEHLLRGLYEVIPPDLLSIFDYQELELLLCGVPDIDVKDWKAYTEYLGVYKRQGARHKIVKWFWAFVETCGPEEKARLLQVRVDDLHMAMDVYHDCVIECFVARIEVVI